MLNPWSKHTTWGGLDRGSRKIHASATSKATHSCWIMSVCCNNRWCVWETFLHTCVGVMWLMSSDASCLSRVVFPPLSRPSSSILTSWSGVLFSLRRMDSNPCNSQVRAAMWCYCARGTGGALLHLTTIAEMHLFLPSIHPDSSLTGRGSAFIFGWASALLTVPTYKDNSKSCE